LTGTTARWLQHRNGAGYKTNNRPSHRSSASTAAGQQHHYFGSPCNISEAAATDEVNFPAMPAVASPDFLATLNQYHPLLWRVCRLYCPDADDQQDLYQEIVLRLWEAWPSFQGRAKRSTWLYRVALNVAISARRQHERRPPPAA